MIIPFVKKSEKRKQDLNRNQDATREELERLLEEEESRKLGDGKGNGRFLFDRFLNEIVIFRKNQPFLSNVPASGRVST